MWSTIIATFLSLIDKIFGIVKIKEEVKKKEFEIKNTEEVVKKAEIVIETKTRDEAQKLVREANEAKTTEAKNKILDSIRRRVGS